MRGHLRADHARHAVLPDGTRIYLRRARESDLRHAQAYFAALSPRSRYLRLMQQTPRLPPSTLAQLRAQLRAPGVVVLVATIARAGGDEIIGGGRIVPTHRRGTCEFALTVIDAWQGRGLGRVLLAALIALLPTGAAAAVLNGCAEKSSSRSMR